MTEFNTTINEIRLRQGDREALTEFLRDLPRPLDPAVRDYLEAHIGVCRERDHSVYLRVHLSLFARESPVNPSSRMKDARAAIARAASSSGPSNERHPNGGALLHEK